MNPWWIAIGTGLTVGGVLSYAIMSDARAAAAVNKAISEVRLPEPSFAMQVPRTAAEFATLDAVVCDCVRAYKPTDPGAPRGTAPPAGAQSEDERTDELVRCAAARLYPTFPWPPMPGDHPSTTELWDTLAVLVRRQTATAACAAVPVSNPYRRRVR